MSDSVDLVDDKLKEADFFLQRLRDAKSNFDEARFYFSAFVSAARSVTFVLQSALSELEDFQDWYAKKQGELKSDRLARFFLEVRNEVQKRGSNPVASFFSGKQKVSVQYFFIYWYGDAPKDVPDLDVVSACEKYLTLLVQLIYECYRKFGPLIDPQQYYTVQKIERLGVSIYDILERDMGVPRDWIDGVDPEAILKQIRQQEPKPDIDHIFSKYLGCDRFGNATR